jgi:hypothetical protein
MNDLWHFTCSHRASLIVTDGVLKPNPQPFLRGAALVWLTDLDVPDRDGLGLTSSFIKCDRTEFRFEATSHIGIEPWITSRWRQAMTPVDRDDFEFYGQPLRWFVATMPVPVLARYKWLDHQGDPEVEALLARYREARGR